MLDNIKIKNFKCFTEKNIAFAPLTMLVGGNGAGKSSVIQSLLVTRKSIEHMSKSNTNDFAVGLNHDYSLQLGLARYVISSSPSSENISFTIQSQEGDYQEFIYHLNEDIDPLSLIGKSVYNSENSPLQKSFRYLNAERMGPRRVQEMAPKTNLQLGFYGEYTNHAIYYADKIHRPVPEQLLGEDKSQRFSHQVEAWLKTIIPSTQIRLETIEKAGTVSLQYQNGQLGTDFYNPPNTGFGITYVLPIIVAGLLASTEEDPVLVIENPEAHLHPLGQSRIGAFLSIVACNGVQVIVETHSEHVVNGARLQLANMRETEKLLINFFSQKDRSIEVDEVYLNAFGELSSWPEGFLDQDRKDLRELLKIKRSGLDSV
ncbi:DUF3696 domain-containing protein [Lysinibacillus sp. M3]|uniref:DUF3696 domain-containing protein n=1 Tax=Lysinibacillus zambalensis TaxID=3160866 RepID=A0ABV1N2F1_9BACI